MAIIDTSKGVRPCVEELANIGNAKNIQNDKHTIFPMYKGESAPNIQELKAGFSWNGLIFKYEGCGVFSAKGILQTAYTGARSSAVPLSTPIPIGKHVVFYRETDTIIYYSLPLIAGVNIKRAENTYNLQTLVQYRIIIPTTQEDYSITSWLSINNSAGAQILTSKYLFGIPKSSIPESATLKIEDAYITEIYYGWSFRSVTANSEIDITHAPNIYFLDSYIPQDEHDWFFSNFTTLEQAQYIITQTDFMQVNEIDRLINVLYTLSNDRLVIDKTLPVTGNIVIAPITNLYTLAEGE